ncbi:hypothetical protein PMAYCL1PPCAC_03222, partial [Pristionchus mayeri]
IICANEEEGDIVFGNAAIVKIILMNMTVSMLSTRKESPFDREKSLMEKGGALYERLKCDSRLRPTLLFVQDKLYEYAQLAFNDAHETNLMDEHSRSIIFDDNCVIVLVRWLNVEANRNLLINDYEEHLGNGISECSACCAAFIS